MVLASIIAQRFSFADCILNSRTQSIAFHFESLVLIFLMDSYIGLNGNFEFLKLQLWFLLAS